MGHVGLLEVDVDCTGFGLTLSIAGPAPVDFFASAFSAKQSSCFIYFACNHLRFCKHRGLSIANLVRVI